MKVILIVMLLFTSQFAYAKTTGNKIYVQLISQDAGENLMAYSYISGVLDTEEMFFLEDMFTSMQNDAPNFRVKHYCFGSDQVTFGQIVDVVKKYLESKPETRHEKANGLIRAALIQSFPCDKNP